MYFINTTYTVITQYNQTYNFKFSCEFILQERRWFVVPVEDLPG